MSEGTSDFSGSAAAVAEEVAAAGETLRAAASRFADDMRGAADTLIEGQKERVAVMAQGVAGALRRSADAFAEDGSALLAREAGRAAEQVERLADTVRRQSWRDSLAEVEGVARRRPEIFFAAAVAAGFLLGRLATSAPAAKAGES
jgi:hypothetical protein